MIKRSILVGVFVFCVIQIAGWSLYALEDIQSLGTYLFSGPKYFYLVPHEDDDLLFMNPDIANQIAQGFCVEVVFATAGDKYKTSDYWLAREAGIKAAYALMAHRLNLWLEDTLTIGDNKLVRFTLKEAPNIQLIFLRLPDGIDLRKGEVTLRNIWQYDQVLITTKDNANMYTKFELVKVFQTLMSRFQATSIGYIFPGSHVDHFYLGQFAELTLRDYSSGLTVVKYRDYNTSTSPPNLNQYETYFKWKVAQEYGKFDESFPKLGNEKYFKRYYKWCQRQYYYEEKSFAAEWLRNQKKSGLGFRLDAEPGVGKAL